MGPTGNGIGGMEMAHIQALNQQLGTEYTLQGVMRFLQTEWHRHERDRNAWEIEKQEMRGRIANLEGQVRRADATQKALRKFRDRLYLEISDEELEANRTDYFGSIKNHPLYDEWHRARAIDLSSVEVPLLSAANWGGQGLHPRGNFIG
jgi:predicted acyl esterase